MWVESDKTFLGSRIKRADLGIRCDV